MTDEEDVQKWLDKDVEGMDAVNNLTVLEENMVQVASCAFFCGRAFIVIGILLQISWHPVSRDVGNVRNREPGLQKPIELDVKGLAKDTKSGSASIMKNWLVRKAKDENEPEEKKAKKEEE